MTDSDNDLPDNIERLKAMLVAERAAHAAERSRLVEQNDRLLHTLRQLQRNQFRITARTVEVFHRGKRVIGKLLKTFAPEECANYFRHAGYGR